MRRSLAAIAAFVALAVLAPAAMAHPLGNFTINHLSTVRVSDDRVDVRYVLDKAEIPTTADAGRSHAELVAGLREQLRENFRLVVDGRPLPLRALEPTVSFPKGQAGLATTRIEQPLRAVVSNPERVKLSDETFRDRVGWKAIVAEPGEGTAVRSTAPSGDPTNGLTRYPADVLNSPLDRRSASFSVEPGDGTLVAPRYESGQEVSTTRGGGDGFAGIFEQAASGEGVLFILLLAAFGWGALHALSPGHGKAMVAAYLVGTKGKPQHAVALGATVTVAHTVGVFLLGFVTLALSQYILPEDLYPWLNLVSGALVVLIGAGVLRSRVRWARARRAAAATGEALPADLGPSADGGHGQHHGHGHDHGHDHGHQQSLTRAGFQHFLDHLRGREHGHGHDHSDHAHAHAHHPHAHAHDEHHAHGHAHAQAHDDQHAHAHHAHGADHGDACAEPDTVTKRSLIGLGAAAGLIPCPSALVVLLGAIAQHEVALGLLLITAFSLGLAGTLTGLGLAVVYARKLAPRLAPRLALPSSGGMRRVAAALPAASALVIVGIGCLLTANALPGVV